MVESLGIEVTPAAGLGGGVRRGAQPAVSHLLEILSQKKKKTNPKTAIGLSDRLNVASFVSGRWQCSCHPEILRAGGQPALGGLEKIWGKKVLSKYFSALCPPAQFEFHFLPLFSPHRPSPPKQNRKPLDLSPRIYLLVFKFLKRKKNIVI